MMGRGRGRRPGNHRHRHPDKKAELALTGAATARPLES
jgi:hypothetical protein